MTKEEGFMDMLVHLSENNTVGGSRLIMLALYSNLPGEMIFDDVRPIAECLGVEVETNVCPTKDAEVEVQRSFVWKGVVCNSYHKD